MALLEVNDLHTSFFTDAGEVKAVDGVSFRLDHGKVLGIVGESGSGKSVTAYSVMQILAPTGKIVSGSVKFDGQELVGADEKLLRSVRGNRISIIFQDPMTSLNPTYTIGRQLMEAILLHTDRNRHQARERAVEMLKLVNVNEPEKRMKQYPFELSGGMRQRVMIAMALACEPDILIADEPTTALDVTIQAQILDLMRDLQKKMGMAIIMITHDLGVVAQMCDEVIVMYAIAHALYIRREYEHAMGIAESALLMAGTRYPIDSIYLNIVLCMICMSLKQDERAEQKFDAAWSIASREGYIHPFVEHHGILQGQVERALRKQEPETYNKIVQSVYRFSRGWMKIHNPVSTLQVTDALTPYEFSIAMLAAKGRSNKEIAALMGVSVNTVKSYMESIFEKLQISSRNEIDAYVNR